MKNVLKAKLMVLGLILCSIEFICGCCQSCKTRGKENQSKSSGDPGNSEEDVEEVEEKKDNKGEKKPNKKKNVEEFDLGGGGKGDKKSKKEEKKEKIEKPEEKEEKHEEEEKVEKKVTDGEKKQAISDFLNVKTGTNRVGIKSNFEVNNDGDGNFTITYGNFTGTIAKNDVDTEQIGKSKLKISVTRPDGKTNIKFDKGGECTLGNFVDSLKKLDIGFRNEDNHEYLAVVDKKNLAGNGDIYINLMNGLIYKCIDEYIGRASIKKQSNDECFMSPYYKSGTYYYYSDTEKRYKICINQDFEKKIFSINYLYDSIKIFEFKLKTN